MRCLTRFIEASLTIGLVVQSRLVVAQCFQTPYSVHDRAFFVPIY